MSNRAKGRAVELACKKELEQQGWLVELADMPKRWKTVQDLFGMFDIIALRRGEKLFIQCKLECSNKKEVLCKLKEFKQAYLAETDIVQLWNMRRRHKIIKKGWEIHSN